MATRPGLTPIPYTSHRSTNRSVTGAPAPTTAPAAPGGQTQGPGTGGYSPDAYGGSGPGTIPHQPYMDKAEDIWNLSRDPQGDLYDRSAQRHLDRTRAGSEARGINMGPVGAGIENEEMRFFEMDWQNMLLDRALAGSQAWQNLMGGAQDIASTGFDNSIRYGESLFRDPEAGGGSTVSSSSGGRTSNYVPVYSTPTQTAAPAEEPKSIYSTPFTDTAGAKKRHEEYLARQMQRITGGVV